MTRDRNKDRNRDGNRDRYRDREYVFALEGINVVRFVFFVAKRDGGRKRNMFLVVINGRFRIVQRGEGHMSVKKEII